MRQRWIAAGALLTVSVVATAPVVAQAPDPGGEWSSYGGTNWSQKYSPLGGQMTTSGPLVTKTLVMLGLAPSEPEDSSTLVAYDKETGDVLGAVDLPSRPLGTPMTYEVGGKQYVALTLADATLVALALP
jgi:glucose dehydrogenase